MQNPLVTVIIPAYRNPDYLRSAIQSVLEQTYQHFEVIVVNDNPENVDLFEGVIEKIGDSRVSIYHHKQNLYIGHARNTGISHAKGEILSFLDDDDLFLPEFLEKQVEAHLNRPEVGMVYCGYIRKWSDGPLKNSPMPAKKPPQDVARAMMRGEFTLHCASVATMKTKCLEKVIGFDPAIETFEDWDMWLRINQEYEMDYIPTPLLIYSHHLTGRSSSSLDRRLNGLNAAKEKYGHIADFKQFYDKYQMDAYYYALRDKVLVKQPEGKLNMLMDCLKECKWFKQQNLKTFVKMTLLLLFGQTSFAVIDY